MTDPLSRELGSSPPPAEPAPPSTRPAFAVEVATVLPRLPRPRRLSLGAVEGLWGAVHQEASVLGEHPLRVLQQRHAALDARNAGLLGFDGLLIAGLAATFAFRLLEVDSPIPIVLAAVAGLAVLFSSWYSLEAMLLPRARPEPDEATLVARSTVDLALRLRDFARARWLTRVAGMTVSLLAGALLGPHLPTTQQLLDWLGVSAR